MQLFRKLLQYFTSTSPIQQPEGVTPALNSRSIEALSIKDKQTVVYIKLKELITDEQEILLYDEYILVADTSFTQVDFAYKDDAIIINFTCPHYVRKQVLSLRDTLTVLFNKPIKIVEDLFVVDNDTRSIYIGKAAHDFMTAVKNEERILH